MLPLFMLPETVIIVHLSYCVSGINRLQSLPLRVGRVLLTFSKPVSGFCWLGGLSLAFARFASVPRAFGAHAVVLWQVYQYSVRL